MTQDELIAMAREADLQAAHDFDYRGSVEAMPLNERQEFMKVLAFARLVAARERAECAAVCDAHQQGDIGGWKHNTPADCAAAIRARGQS